MVGLGGGAEVLADGPPLSDLSMTLIISSLTVIVSRGPFVVGVDDGDELDVGGGGRITVNDADGAMVTVDICGQPNARFISRGAANCCLGGIPTPA